MAVEEAQAVFFRAVAPDRLTMLYWMAPQTPMGVETAHITGRGLDGVERRGKERKVG